MIDWICLSEGVVLDIIFDTDASIVGSDMWESIIWEELSGTHQVFFACGGGFVHEMLKLDEWVMGAREGSVWMRLPRQGIICIFTYFFACALDLEQLQNFATTLGICMHFQDQLQNFAIIFCN